MAFPVIKIAEAQYPPTEIRAAPQTNKFGVEDLIAKARGRNPKKIKAPKPPTKAESQPAELPTELQQEYILDGLGKIKEIAIRDNKIQITFEKPIKSGTYIYTCAVVVDKLSKIFKSQAVLCPIPYQSKSDESPISSINIEVTQGGPEASKPFPVSQDLKEAISKKLIPFLY
jgi:hypothetical protein